MNKVRYGILSTSQIARKAHLAGSRLTSNSEITAISSRSMGKAEKWAHELGIAKAYGTYEELINDPEIDAVINPLPNSMHCEWTIKAAQSGKHVLCEKPLATNVQEVIRIKEAAEENNVLVMEAFTHRFGDEANFIRALIASGAIGKVRTVFSDLTYVLQDWENDVRANKPLAGGSLLDCGCYCISLIRYVLSDEVDTVQGYQSVRMPNDVDATFSGMLKFQGGTLATFFSSMEASFEAELVVLGEKGKIALSNFFTGNKVTYSIDGKEYIKEFEKKDRFSLQMEHFSDCIINKKQPIFTLDDAKCNMSVIDALKESARTGIRVKL